MPQADLDNPRPKQLNFSVYDVTDLASVAPYIATLGNRCGIYVLRFADGTAYVGKTGDVVRRFSSHYRDWGKKLPDIAIEQVEFAPCDAECLDESERDVIGVLERTVPVRNKLLTKWPGGRGDIEIRRKNATPIRIPVDRALRTRLTGGAKVAKLRRHWEYMVQPNEAEISAFIGAYISEAMPSPEATAGTMWTCTALPTTGDDKRLVTISVGGLETLYVVNLRQADGTVGTWVWMNVAIPEDRPVEKLVISTPVCEAKVVNYKSESVWCWKLDLSALADPDDGRFDEIFRKHLIRKNELDDLAYQLNRRLMARQPSKWIPSHNAYLASTFLTHAMDHELSYEG